MNKKSFLWLALDLIFLIIFNTVFFVLMNAEHIASVWISYAFIHLAYLMLIVTPFLIRKSSSAAVFGFSIYSISSAYFFVELVVGIVFIILRQESFVLPLIIQMVVFGIYAFILISHLIANESTADSIERHTQEVAYIKEAASRVKALVGKIPDKKANRDIQRVYDLLHSSPSHSVSFVSEIENEISNSIYDLQNAVELRNIGDVHGICINLINLIDERNTKLEAYN